MPERSLAAAVAAHRFGLGEASLAVVGGDAQGWLAAQIAPMETPRGDALLDTRRGLALFAVERERRQAMAAGAPPGATPAFSAAELNAPYREAIVADLRSRLATAAATTRPFAERMQLFWANHFTVSVVRGAVRGLVGPFEGEAIRPHVFGRFEDMLFAATTHPAMLRYLDNGASAGPRSRVVVAESRRAERRQDRPRVSGVNENLAREVLELHTLGAAAGRGTGVGSVGGVGGGYAQADVTAFAALLTGWRVGPRDDAAAFDPAWHEPGPKMLLGKSYGEGPEALREVLHDLATHPATARHVATRLARHVVADEPPAALVDHLASTFRRTDGDLAAVSLALIRHPAAWSAPAAKLKTPEEFVVSTARLLRLGERMFERVDVRNPAAGVAALGQRLHAAPSPAGWSDRADDWLGPDGVWKRVEWATRLAEGAGKSIDARPLAEQSLGARLAPETARQIERAADGPQALSLLLLAPEFQRR